MIKENFIPNLLIGNLKNFKGELYMYLFILSIIISIIIGIIFLCIECYHRTDLRLLDKIEHFFFSFICGITITNIVFTLGSLMYIGIKGIEKNPIINNTFPIQLCSI